MFSIEVQTAKNFRLPLERAASAVNKNTPIETCVLIEVDETEGMFLTTLDSRTHQLRLRVPAVQVFNSGSCILNAELLNRMVKTMSDDMPIQLQVDPEENQLIVQQPGTRIQLDLFTDPVDMFPVERNLPRVLTNVDAEMMSSAIEKSIVLSGKDEFITFLGEGEQVKLYTRCGGRMFSRTIVDSEESLEPWSVGVPVTLLARFPKNLAGRMDIHMDEHSDVLVFNVGEEHLLIRRLVTDNVSFLVDTVLNKKSDKFWTVRAEGLLSDLKRAAIIKDKEGIQLSRFRHQLQASYASGGKGSATSNHDLLNASEAFEPMNLDPVLFERAAKALEAVDLVGEQVAETVPAILAGQKPQTHYNLRLLDQDSPDHRAVVITSLQVN